jgi:hypothetical protein
LARRLGSFQSYQEVIKNHEASSSDYNVTLRDYKNEPSSHNLYQLNFYKERFESALKTKLKYDTAHQEALRMYAESDASLQEALQIFRQIGDKEKIANVLDEMGDLYKIHNKILDLSPNKLLNAMNVYKEAYTIYQNLAKKNPDKYAASVTKVKVKMQELKKEAIDNSQLEIFQETKPINMPLTEVSQTKTTDNIDPEEEALKQNLAKLKQLADKFPENNIYPTLLAFEVLEAYYRDKDKDEHYANLYNEGFDFCKKMLEEKKMRENEKGFIYSRIINAYKGMGKYYKSKHQLDKAETTYEKGIGFIKTITQFKPDLLLDVALDLDTLSHFYFEDNKIKQAIETSEKALSTYKKIMIMPSIIDNSWALSHIVGALNNIALIYTTTYNCKEALTHFSEALSEAQKDSTLVFNSGGIYVLIDSSVHRKDYIHRCQAGKLLAENLEQWRKVHEYAQDAHLYNALNEYMELSWWSLLAKDFRLTTLAANKWLNMSESDKKLLGQLLDGSTIMDNGKTVENDKTNYALKNLAHSLILQGQYNTAQIMYLKLKNLREPDGKSFKEVILDDFKTLEAEGITHKDIPRMKAEIEKW